MKFEKAILLSGTMRSGTTLMCKILDSSPSINMVSDVLNWFWHRCLGQYGMMNSKYQLEKCFYELEPFIIYGLNEERKEFFLSGEIKNEIINNGISYEEIYRTFIKYYKNGLTRFNGDKTTHNYDKYESFITKSSDSIIIHMVRDVSDVFYSHKKRVGVKKKNDSFSKKLKNVSNEIRKDIGRKLLGNKHAIDVGNRMFTPFVYKYPLKIVDEWLLSNSAALHIKEQYPEKILIIKYEDLVTDTTEILDKISGRLGLSDKLFDINNLKKGNNEDFVANSSFEENKVKGIHSKSVNQSEGNLTEKEKSYIDKRCRKIKKALEY
ncbi:sulfotransferase domain-containing protein [Aliifodinibius salicampi]|uniref:Sulfotransferase domain-containing protein n=1 Tax=Fodinibius salicampi TaxID=1920655 RepID=A0ABT3PYZ5_9BACT|nr:sulfotransferase [Fodinibius salicampi]MCW9713067.1 sulfotransferase domain-containing protein [Fodinibius salicampi]